VGARRPASDNRSRAAAAAAGRGAACRAAPTATAITVGSVPDDYRTNHPIMIAEKERSLDLPVGTGDRGADTVQRGPIEGFLANYDRSAANRCWILVPAGAQTNWPPADAARDFRPHCQRERRAGEPGRDHRLIRQARPRSPRRSGVTFTAIRPRPTNAAAGPRTSTGDNRENKHYANFGCSYQNNLAAQIANPNDLLGPRKPTEIDAEKRGAVIDDYRDRGRRDFTPRTNDLR
jgi:pilus assembly protein CpaD